MLAKILALLKKIFPHPSIAPKRYLVIAGLIIYYAFKVYVTVTPSPEDDAIPDQLKSLVEQIWSNED